MTRIASHLFRLFAITAVLTVGLCSMMMNWRFGLHLGSTHFDGVVLGVFSVGLDVVKWLSPLFVGFAFANRAYVRSAAALLIWVACVIYSFTAAIGFSASNREAVTLTQQLTQDQLAQTRERLKRANEDLATLRSNPRWSASSACTTATLSQSVSLCHRAQSSGTFRTLKRSFPSPSRLPPSMPKSSYLVDCWPCLGSGCGMG
jgi:hypothetical protein